MCDGAGQQVLVLVQGAFPGGSDGKSLPAVRKSQVWSLGWKNPLEKGMATHSTILAWRIPQTEEPGGLVLGSKIAAWVPNTTLPLGLTFMVLSWSGDTLRFSFHLERVTSHVEIIPGVSACKLHLFFVNARSVGKITYVWGCVKSLVKCGKSLGFRVNPKSLFYHFQPMGCQVSFLNSLNLFSAICKMHI